MARMDYKEICAKALRCRGLQWWRWRQLNWKEVERDKSSGPHPQRFKIYRWEDMVAGEVPNLWETRMVCRKLSKTTRVGCILLKTVEAGSNSRNVGGFDGFDGGFEGFGGGFDGLDGFAGGVAEVAETEGSRAQKR